jgi:hypothetical protein
MSETFESFLKRIPNLDALTRDELVHYFLYFLTKKDSDTYATPAQVATCFTQAELTPYPDVRIYMHRGSRPRKQGRAPLVHSMKKGYRLERSEKERVQKSLIDQPFQRDTSTSLRGLIGKLALSQERDFLDEAIKCYEVQAYRAAIIMVWILVIDHLQEFILKHHLASFNIELAKVKDKRVKVTTVTVKDDFGDIPEGKFIEIVRAANIISNDVRKILTGKLDIRNSYAHPSNITLSPAKAADFITDLTDNVVLKYPL